MKSCLFSGPPLIHELSSLPGDSDLDVELPEKIEPKSTCKIVAYDSAPIFIDLCSRIYSWSKFLTIINLFFHTLLNCPRGSLLKKVANRLLFPNFPRLQLNNSLLNHFKSTLPIPRLSLVFLLSMTWLTSFVLAGDSKIQSFLFISSILS